MFRGAYQGGEYLELLSVRGKDALKQWKASHSVSRDYDATTKGYVVSVLGGAGTKLEIPANSKTTREFPCSIVPYMR